LANQASRWTIGATNQGGAAEGGIHSSAVDMRFTGSK
jgi:hypothetical protein